MGIETKTIGVLIDELITCNLRCWFAQESLMDTNLSEKERLDAAVRAQVQNARRSSLIKAIDLYFDENAITAVDKTYYTYFKDEKK